MAGNAHFAQQLQIMTPHTYNALQKLVMAMADVSKNTGKKTFFGRDKGQDAYDKFQKSLKATMQCMVLDSVIKESTSTEDVINELKKKIQHFQMVYPNWQEAYVFAEWFFEDEDSAVSTIDRLR